MRATLRLDGRRPWADRLDLARRAEAAGWDSVRVEDEIPAAECWTTLGALACTVPRVQLQAVVDDARGRHPATVAKLASTVDGLSGGRLLLGLAPAPDAEGRARLAEAFQVVKGLSALPRASCVGKFYRLRDAPLDPKPRQQPFPLMLVGADAHLAARVADHWSVLGDADEIAAQLIGLVDGCARIGRDRAELTVSAPYPAAGVDEWVVSAAAFGPDRTDQDRSLAHIRAEAARTDYGTT